MPWLVLTAAVAAGGETHGTGGAMPATLQLAVTQSQARSAGPQYYIDGDRLGANPRHGLALSFTPQGAVIEGREGGFALELERFGRGDGDPVRHEHPLIDGAWIEYRRGAGLTEWFVNLPEGLEQGWMVTDRPTGTGPLVLELDTATPADRVHGEQLVWSGLVYHRLVTVDVEGRVLPTRWTHDGARLRIEVDDHESVYPLLIDPWIQEETKLTASDGAQEDEFGGAVALAEDTAVVGAAFADPDGNDAQGAAYVFTPNDGIWGQQAKLTAPDGGAGDLFGTSVALAGDTAVVGATRAEVDGNRQGAAYVFVRNGEVWTQQAKLTASDGTCGDKNCDAFGVSVAVAGDTALVGAPGHNDSAGAVYIFNNDDGTWFERTKLTADDAEDPDRFGTSVAFDNGTALIGAPDTNQIPGAAYVFNRDGDGVWGQRAKLTADDGAAGDGFAQDVALSGDTALVGAWGVNGFQGAAYVFTGADETWSQQAKLTADDGAASDDFGFSVALADDVALIGARKNLGQGATYVFTRSEGSWSERSKLTASDGAEGDFFGQSLAMTSDTAMVGAIRADVDGSEDQGAAYVFVDFVPLPDFGTIEGTVRSLGYCRADVAPLEGVTVEIVGAENTYTAETDANGFYQAFLPPGESPLDMTVAAPGHLPATVEDISFTGGDTVVQGFDLVLDATCASVDPTALSVSLNPDQTTTEALILGNADEAEEELTWTIAATGPAAPSDASDAAPSVQPSHPIGATVDCENEPGIIVHDDGTVDLGYSATDQVSFIDRFTPGTYPRSFRALCLAWTFQGGSPPTPLEFEFEIVAFDDGGPDGGPGRELGALSVTTTDIPEWPVDTPTWVSFDISSLGIPVDSGSVYIGARWAPLESTNVFLTADQNPDQPPGFAGGYWWTEDNPVWTPIEVNFVQYRSMFVRAVEWDCLDPNAVPWLSVEPTSGSTPVGGTSAVQVSFNSAALTPGAYQANVCIATNDPVKPLIVVPVTLSVTVPTPALAFDPTSLDFGKVEVGDTSAPLTATLTNSGDADATGLTFTPPASGFAADTAACGDILAADANCEVVVTFTPTEPGPAGATLQVGSAEAATADLKLVGTGLAARVITPVALDVDPEAFLSDGNGLFEPGELVEVMPSWRNDSLLTESLTGDASEYGGTDGAIYFLALDDADYGTLEPAAAGRCDDTGVCYFLGANAPNGRPATHWMASFEETLSEGTTKTWDLHIGDSFTDVPRSSPFYEAVETLLHHGVTGGCTVTEYCPAGTNTRGQMATFLLKAAEDPGYEPPACVEGEERFDDVPFDSPFCPWIEELAGRQVTAGCGGDNYCPGDAVSRAQMAVFLLRAFEGGGYTPPACAGEFGDVDCASPFATWVEELAERGITGGCGGGNYCPGDAVTRAQMAVFVVNTFGLELYGP